MGDSQTIQNPLQGRRSPSREAGVCGQAPRKAVLLISLDLEQYWGVHDICSLDSCKSRLLQTGSAVARILDLFVEHGVHATWAIVGFLFFRTREELMHGLPAIKPDYRDPQFSPYPGLSRIGADEAEDPFRYGPSLIEAVRNTPHQEIGTHTFSHFYCLEDGQTEAAFRDDLEAAARVAAQWNVNLRSLVFPRNQVNPAYLKAATDQGIHAYRGAGSHWIYQERKRSDESQWRRAVRLLDAYVNLSGHHTVPFDDRQTELPFNFPASRLLRGYSPALRLLEPLRIARIRSGLKEAAQKRRIYHLWLHPEEMALDQDQNLAALRKILRCYATLRERGEMESLSMGELAARKTASNVGALSPLHDRSERPRSASGLLVSQGAG